MGQHNEAMPSLESNIDRLYEGPLNQFVAARQALAKTLTGDEARQVKQLPKPTVAAWAVNQVYWRTRPVYDRLTKSGKKLRSAQIAALNGRSLDLRDVANEHRAAVAHAVTEALRLAGEADAHPNTDELSRTFEALSMETDRAEPAGRSISTDGRVASARKSGRAPEATARSQARATAARTSGPISARISTRCWSS